MQKISQTGGEELKLTAIDPQNAGYVLIERIPKVTHVAQVAKERWDCLRHRL
jgi:hypothetical protein